MPQLVTARIRRSSGHPLRIWVPVLPVVVVLSPLLLLAVPVAVVACRRYRISAVRAFGTALRIICALPGTRFDLEQGHTAVLVTVR
ncbi:DUF58 domain-containing protein [Frankia sp. AiPs1]|uniref:hypothetical protein n=1 Tax=Frankia sp. AiPa1 TaxID=573492 RepID=UPI00202B795A|nr:hypothetical protein [Frankia sp. AiPa1]MCL9758483.1 hypothetical protein [Frankia sp. AiPa1]